MMLLKNLGIKASLALLLSISTNLANAHELMENRATMVLRDQTHLSMTLFLNYPEILHRTLAPELSFQEFLLRYSSITPEQFKLALNKAQTLFQNQITLDLGNQKKTQLERWVWPEPERVQTALRERIMQAMVAPSEHAHQTPIEIRAEAQLTKAVKSLRIQYPAAFQQVLVVSYRPSQVWVKPNEKSAEIRF